MRVSTTRAWRGYPLDKNQNLPKETLDIISSIMKFIEKSEADFIVDRDAQGIEEDKNENSR